MRTKRKTNRDAEGGQADGRTDERTYEGKGN